jgi:hypothetical protein
MCSAASEALANAAARSKAGLFSINGETINMKRD